MVTLNPIGNAVVRIIGIVPAGEHHFVQSAEEPPIETGEYNAARTANGAIAAMLALQGIRTIPLMVLPP